MGGRCLRMAWGRESSCRIADASIASALTRLCSMELPRKLEFFRIFHLKIKPSSSSSEFSLKNVFFWGTSCWCSSKIKKVWGEHISCNCSLWVPSQFLNFYHAFDLNNGKKLWPINIYQFERFLTFWVTLIHNFKPNELILEKTWY